MRRVLGVKKPFDSNANDAWLHVYENIESYVSENEVNDYVGTAVQRLQTAEKKYGRLAYGWSGGKDSLAVEWLIKESGINTAGGIFVEFENEYPAFLEWLKAHKPADVETVHIDNFSLDFIAEHMEYLFPIDSKIKQKYTPPRWKPQNDFCTRTGAKALLMGRRTIDGNHCGKDGISAGAGITKYSFIHDWPQEVLLGLIRYKGIELPPFYFYPNGFVYGTYPWTVRRRVNNSYHDTWAEIDTFDHSIIEIAAEKLVSARNYLEGKNADC